ncbi:tubulin-tyrosine ligase PBY1 [Apiospora kogelbergensis]|uniref:tubulin-tyrosine ligase PBY1 n=1 Tax=Apiospora kogelbergensis TaxID=1337665 RepID=UPI00312D4764
MHILVTNDDGPPSPTSSPYVHSFVRALQRAGHTVSVCLPHTQRSWIGKAHMVGETVKPSYYRPSETFDPTPPSDSAAAKPQGTTHSRPSKSRDIEEWILVDGTPASTAAQWTWSSRAPTTAETRRPSLPLSSGTLGGALEAAVCRQKAIAVSYAFFSRNHDPDIIEGASAHSVRVIESLHRQWPADASVDLYSVNVPLVEGVGKNKTLFTEMLQNYWSQGSSCFTEVEGSVGDEDEEERRIRESEGREGVAPPEESSTKENEAGSGYTHRHFKWSPRFTDVYNSVEESPPGNDGWAVKEGLTSITPMKANFYHAAPHLHGTELKLEQSQPQDRTMYTTREHTPAHQPKPHFYALIAYEDPYVQPLILLALSKLFPAGSYTLLSLPETHDPSSSSEISISSLLPASAAGASPSEGTRVLQITPYELVDWSYVSDDQKGHVVINSYMLRKALIRKHYLGTTIEHWVAKHPESVLTSHFRRGDAFEVDYAEFLDDALVEAFDLRASLDKNEEVEDAKDREWWILKPGMSDRGQGIRLFSTMEELQGIFDGWEEADEDEEEGEDNEDEDGANDRAAIGRRQEDDYDEDKDDGITASHLRHFVAQPYIHPPLLLPAYNNRKFHIRTYVLCVGSLDVYVYREMLALFAGKPYVAPWEVSTGDSASGEIDLEAHLTNTCLQRTVKDGSVRRFWDIDIPATMESGSSPFKNAIFDQICAITGDLFQAAAQGGMTMHFQPLPNAFEVFGLDFLVDATGTAFLLEVNSFPDFKQTGDELNGLVQGLWEGVMALAVRPRFGGGDQQAIKTPSAMNGEGARHDDRESYAEEVRDMVHVRSVDLGRRFG